MENITLKTLEEKLAEGWTTKQFAEYYGMTEKDFFASLDKISPVKSYIAGIIRRLNKNDKKSRLNISSSNIQVEEVIVESTKKVKEPTFSFTETDSIDNLLKRKEELITSINKSEEYISKTPSYISYIEEQIAKEKARHEQYMAGYLAKIDRAKARQQAVSENIKQNSDELKKIIEAIESLSNIQVIVTENGEIIIKNSNISIPQKWQDTCFDLMRSEDFKNLDIKDMKTLAKLWCLINSEENISQKFQINFESKRLEDLFDLYKKYKKN